ncbi:MAG: adenine deaminase [Lachnospiraceae bacterium]|nr:adenine deaminase [Lachnospiraceae bacterium]
MDYSKFKKLSGAVLNGGKADLILKNANIIDVITGRIRQGSIIIKDGVILRVVDNGSNDTADAEKVVDLNGAYVSPGFMDAHLHLESTMVSPAELIAEAAAKGTTTFIVDPHEAANVSGADGINYILDQTADSDANVYVMMPSCVPATPLDDNGCIFTAEDMKPYLDNERILGLGEVMDDPSVIYADKSMHDKLALFGDKIIDGHAPFLPDRELDIYSMAGIMTDHEATSFEYALKEAERGIHVHIREGSAAHNCADIVKGIVKSGINTDCFSFCTDDKHIEDILRDGHISANIRIAIKEGVPPISAYQMATINTARTYGLKHLGAIVPGAQADLVVLSSLENVDVTAVYYKGKKVEKSADITLKPCPDKLKHTMNFTDVNADSFKLSITGEETHVIGIDRKQITTTDTVRKFDVTENYVPDGNSDILKIAAVERHKNTGKIGVALASGYGLKGGAVASSVSHDSHNIIVIGDNDRDIALAVNALKESGGGYVIVEDGKVFEVLPLPIMGLMSDAGFATVDEKLQRMKKKAYEMGVDKDIDPFITLSFLALPVIPEIRITPRGLCKLDSKGLYLV